MAPPTPTGTTTFHVPSLGTIKGLIFEDGTRQFCAIPYANLTKRWTRSVLNTLLKDGFHDGTQHGPICPQPPEYAVEFHDMVPIRRCSHFKPDVESEADALNLNVVMPEGVGPTARLPVMVWIHGGSFIFGAATHPGYDMVNLVSFSNARGTPIVGVSINYRVGLFGFLASAAIRDDLAKDGFKGVGNFGLTDQQTALDWVQRYIGAFGGDPGNVTIFGESAGGMSVCHHTWAANPATFHRGISMSGSLHTWPVWSLEQHERRWNVLLKRFGIDPLASDALDRLRDVPEAEIAVATCPIEGTIDATGNMCDDGWFYASSPSPGKYTSPPAWLNSFMIGNVTHEGMIFSHNLSVQTLELARQRLSIFLKEPEIELVLRAYGINPSASTDD